MVYKKQKLDSDYENRVLNAIASGAGPDVWAMPNAWVFRHTEKLAPMPEGIAKSVNLDKQYVQSIKESVYINDKTYALSPSVEPLMVYYNPSVFSAASKAHNEANKGDKEAIKRANDLLTAPPKTWTDFVEASNIISQNGVAALLLAQRKYLTRKIFYTF